MYILFTGKYNSRQAPFLNSVFKLFFDHRRQRSSVEAGGGRPWSGGESGPDLDMAVTREGAHLALRRHPLLLLTPMTEKER